MIFFFNFNRDIKTIFIISLLCYVSSGKKYMGKILKKFIYLRKIYHSLNFLAPYLKLDTTLCLYFDLEYQWNPLHIT